LLSRLIGKKNLLRLVLGVGFRTCVAIAGEDYCVIAADTRMSTGFSILTRNYSKIHQM
jgi:20S proteasome alpha/beta subunit